MKHATVLGIPRLTTFDPNWFSIKDMPEDDRKVQARQAAKVVAMSI